LQRLLVWLERLQRTPGKPSRALDEVMFAVNNAGGFVRRGNLPRIHVIPCPPDIVNLEHQKKIVGAFHAAPDMQQSERCQAMSGRLGIEYALPPGKIDNPIAADEVNHVCHEFRKSSTRNQLLSRGGGVRRTRCGKRSSYRPAKKSRCWTHFRCAPAVPLQTACLTKTRAPSNFGVPKGASPLFTTS